jgi:hypothetical protein
MPLSPAHRVLLGAAAVAATAGIAVAVEGRGGDRGGSGHGATTTVAATQPASVSGYDLAGALSETSAIRTSPASFDAETLAMVAAQQSVDTERAWPLEIPGDDRTAWLFAGAKRLALVVPRTVIDPVRGPLPDAFSVFGSRIVDLADRPLVAVQAGAGQEQRTFVLVPEGVEAPRIVAHDGIETVRAMPHSGRLYADRIRPGEQLVVGTRRIGPTDTD